MNSQKSTQNQIKQGIVDFSDIILWVSCLVFLPTLAICANLTLSGLCRLNSTIQSNKCLWCFTMRLVKDRGLSES